MTLLTQAGGKRNHPVYKLVARADGWFIQDISAGDGNEIDINGPFSEESARIILRDMLDAA